MDDLLLCRQARVKLRPTLRSSMTLLKLDWLGTVNRAASLLKKMVAAGPAPPVQDSTKGTKEACLNS